MRRRPRGRGRSVDRGTCGPGIEPRKAITSGCRRRRRMRKADKTRLIEFGPFAAENRRRRGEGKPETFDFLGFTHICGTKGSNGRFTVLRQTMRERLQAKLGQVKIELRRRLHDPVPEVGSWLRSVVGGHLRYYGVPMNSRAISLFRLRVGWLWNRSMRRRSQKTRLTWERMSRLIDHWLPPPRVCHPYPLYRLGVIPEASWRIILIHPTPSGEPSHAARTCQRLGGHRRSPSTGHCADCHHGAASSIRRTPSEASLLWTRPPCQRLGGDRRPPSTGHCAHCRHGASSSIRRTQNGAVSHAHGKLSTARIPSSHLSRPTVQLARGRATLTKNVSRRLVLASRAVSNQPRQNRDTVGREQGALVHTLNRAMGGFAGNPESPSRRGAVSRQRQWAGSPPTRDGPLHRSRQSW